MLKPRFLSGLAAGVAAMTLAATPLQAAEPIKIGTFLAVTGPASFLGDPELKTLQASSGARSSWCTTIPARIRRRRSTSPSG